LRNHAVPPLYPRSSS